MKIFIESEEYPYSFNETRYRIIFSIGTNYIDAHPCIDYWSMQDYKKQWQDAITHFKSHDTTCFIDSIESDKDKPSWIRSIILYKKNNQVIIQHLYLEDKDKKTFITKDNCYSFIPEYHQYQPIFYGMKEYEWTSLLATIDNDIRIQITNKTPQKEFGQSDDNNVIRTKITVNNYTQRYKTPIDDWSIKMYQQQWKSGLERIKTHDSSCLIMRIDQKKYPMMSWWLLYKKGDTIFIYNDYLLEDEFEELGIHHKLTPENCYDSIPSHEQQKEKYRIKEWIADISDVQNLTIETVDSDDMPVKDSLKDLIERK